MNNSLTSLAIFGLLGVAAIALPGFAPQVAAGETSVLAKSDRLFRLSREIVHSRSGHASTRSVCIAARRWFAKFAWSRRAPR